MSGHSSSVVSGACSEEAQWGKWAILFQNPHPHGRPTPQTLSKAEGESTPAPLSLLAQNHHSLSTRNRDADTEFTPGSCRDPTA